MRRLSFMLVLLALTSSAVVEQARAVESGVSAAVPEPPGYRRNQLHGRTPQTVAGAKVIDESDLAALKAKHAPVMIDVANLDVLLPGDAKRPPVLAKHLSIPGSTWMPGAGSGRTDAAFETAFDRQIADLTGGDKSKPVVTFCHPDRWGSWNAAKRIAAAGYTHVYWLPRGTEGWSKDHDVAPATEDPAWKSALVRAGPDPTADPVAKPRGGTVSVGAQ